MKSLPLIPLSDFPEFNFLAEVTIRPRKRSLGFKYLNVTKFDDDRLSRTCVKREGFS